MNSAKRIAISLAKRVPSKAMSIHASLHHGSRHLSTGPERRDSPRRRKRGSAAAAGDGDSSRFTNAPNAITNIMEFIVAAQNFLDKIEVALFPMEQVNDVFIVQRTPSKLTITLAPPHGQYVLEIVEDLSIIRFVSPVSGGYTYVCDQVSGEWESQQDGHRLEGLLVRDLLRQVNGLPDL